MSQTAAFIRAEGALVAQGALFAAAYIAANAQGLRERAMRLGHIAVAAPVHALLGQNDRSFANRLTWAALRGMSEDRVHVLADELYRERIEPAVLGSGIELVHRARRDGHRVVLFSESIGLLVEPLAAHVRRVDDVVCNHLEMRDGEATGRLLEPVVGGHDGARWVREYAARHDIDLTRSVAFGSRAPDTTLLAVVGHPCAVNADFTLRRAAVDARWAQLDYAA